MVTCVCYKDGGQSEKWEELWHIEHGPGNQDWRMENVKQETEIQCFL